MSGIEILTNDLQAAGLPVVGVAVLSPGMVEESHWHVFDAADGSRVRVDFSAEPTAQQLTDAAAIVLAWDPRPRQTRPIAAIYQDLAALSTAQQDAIIADLQVSQLQGKWSTLTPPQDAPAAALRWSAVSLGGATAAEKRQAAGWITAMWCQQNPKYLVNPTFHASLAGVSIAGDEPI